MVSVIGTYIHTNPQIAHGKPVFKGTRIMVYLVLEMLAAGKTFTDIKRSYPKLTKKHIQAALQFAAHTPEVRGSLVEFGHAVPRR